MKILLLFGLLSLSSGSLSQQTEPAISAPVSGVRYEVTFNSAGAARRLVHTVMSFDVAGRDDVILSLPAWTPGDYEIKNFARNVSGFSASQNETPIEWNKSDYDSWSVRPAGAGRVLVSFDYEADTLDNSQSWSRPDFLLFNGTNLFMYPEGRSLDFGATVSIATERGWKVLTGMMNSGPATFTAANYHDLVDMPFFIGAFDLDSARISGRWVRFGSYPEGSVTGSARTRVWAALKQVIPPQARVFGEVPWNHYSVMQITDPSYPVGSGSGLEHQNSHVDIISPSLLNTPVMPSLYAHEIFHAWNVKRLRPADLTPYRYAAPQPTPLLWISEGITDYYADLVEVRGGAIDEAEFYRLTGRKVASVERRPPTSLEDASLSAWIHPRDDTDDLYYDKGSLAGLLLDILVRDGSNNRKSLDDVMRTLYVADFKAGKGFTRDEWWAAVTSAAGGSSFAEFDRKYVKGREPFPLREILPLAGMKFVEDSIREPRVGVASLQDSAGVKVLSVLPGSTAEQAGVQPGDYLLSIGDISIEDPGFGQKFRPKYASSSEGSPLSIRIRRLGREMVLQGKLGFGVRVESRIERDAHASSKARAIRDGLLRGTTRAVVR